MSALRRSSTILLRTLLVLAVLAALAAGALHWASRSDAVLRWAIEQVGQRLPGKLTVTGMHGALVRPVHFDTIEYVQDDLTLKATDVDLEWSPTVLALGRRLSIQSLHAASVQLTLRDDGGPGGAPGDLGLPLPASVDRLQVGALRIEAGAIPIELSGVDLAYQGDARFHSARVARLGTQWGDATGQLQFLAQPPFTLSGEATFSSGAWKAWPFSARARLGGTLEQITAEGGAQIRELPPVSAKVTLAPFAPVLLAHVDARVTGLELASLVPDTLQAALDVHVTATGTAGGGLAGQVQVGNRSEGPIDQGRLPVAGLTAAFEASPEALVLRDAALELGGEGRATGEAVLRPDSIQARLAVAALDLRRLHSALRATALGGTIAVTRTDAGEQIEADLGQAHMRAKVRATRAGDRLEVQALDARIGQGSVQAQGHALLSGDEAFSAQARFAGLDPALLGEFPAARLTGRAQVQGRLVPGWMARVDYTLERSQWLGQPLGGEGRLAVSPARVHDIDARLALAGNRLALRGALGRPEDRLQFRLQAPALSALRRGYAGALDAEGSVGGTLRQPFLDAKVQGRDLALPDGYRARTLSAQGRLEPGADPRVSLSAKAGGLSLAGFALEHAQLQVEGTRSAHRITAQADHTSLDVATTLEGGLDAALQRWTGRVLTLEGRGAEPVHLVAPAPLDLSRERVTFGPAEIAGANGRLHISESMLAKGRLSSSGSIESLRVARLLQLFEVQSPVETNLVLGGRWSLSAERDVNGRIELFRQSGDVTVPVDEQRYALDLERLEADVRVEANRVRAVASATAKGIDIGARLETRLAQRDGRWGLPGTAPLVLDAHARVDSIRPLAALLSPAVLVNGKAALAVTANGTVADPNLTGRLEGTGLSVEQVSSGLYLADGKLQAHFADDHLFLDELAMRSGDGRVAARGDYDLRTLALKLDWTADHLNAIQRPDLLLVASGSGSVMASDNRLQFTGKVRMDRGRVELRDVQTRGLGDDVVIVGRKPPSPLPERVIKSKVDFTLDLGEDFMVKGRGLDARVVGMLRLTSPGDAPLRATGEIKVARGTFEIFGRKLQIDPGKLYFTGPLDNPAIEIRAMRGNQAVEAGVELTGTAKNMEVRLVSVPEVPEMEKLGWLTLGRKIDTGNQTEAESMQRYGAALATTIGTGSLQSRMANAVGLDEITVLPGADQTAQGSGGIVQVGKRVSDRIYVMLEQRLSTAENVFKVNYQLTRAWSVRLESGDTDALDIFYTISWD